MADTDDVTVAIRARGISKNEAQELPRSEVSEALFDAVKEALAEHDIDAQQFTTSVEDTGLVKVPTHDAPEKPPTVEGWVGGDVRPTIDDSFYRMFRNEDRHVKIAYDVDNPADGVSVCALSYVKAIGRWMDQHDIIAEEKGIADDEEAFAVSEELMRAVNDGEFDQRIAMVRDEKS